MKSFAKACLRDISFVTMLPLILVYRLQCLVTKNKDSFSGWSQLIALIPGTTGVYLRHAFYRSAMENCGRDACISFGTIFSHSGATVGKTAYIGNYCSIGDIQIGDDVLIASHVSIMNGCQQHGLDRLDVPVREQIGTYPPVSIGEDTWIGERATVAASVGKHCVIGAGALVLTPIPDYSVAVGVPAKIVKDRRDIAVATDQPEQQPASNIPATDAAVS